VDAVETLTARSPDGRTWEIGATREHMTFAGNRDEPGFWAGVVVTAILIVLTIVFAWISTTVAILAGIVLGIWLLERPRLYARTEGPPREEVVWKANRFARGQLEQRIVEAVERGNPDVEPPGLTLLQD
jgi:hypothetical protein